MPTETRQTERRQTEKRHLLLLTIDAWRADFLDTFLGHPLVPALDRFADRSARFTRLSANGPWTTPAMVSMLTGRPVLEHGVHYAWSTPDPGPSLAGVLAANGWRCPNLCYLTRVANYANLGYAAADAPASPERDDPTLFEALEAVDSQPVHLWYHYKYVHLPYWATDEHRAQFGVSEVPARLRESVGTGFVVPREDFTLDPADRGLVQRMYAACVREMSDWLDRVFDAIDATGQADRFTIVITADHGDEHLEHGHVGHASTAHHGRVWDEILRIPCVVIDPRINGPLTIDDRIEGLDLFPTLLRLMDVPVADHAGVDFAPALLHGRPVEADPDRIFVAHSSRWGYQTPRAMDGQHVVSLTDGRIKYVREAYDAPWDALFDLQSDPGEQHPLNDPARLALWRASWRAATRR
ncbi:MAG: choline-sulfatase [Bradymonadia bacterium]|jgi:choline-sulfatase